ncbi:MAG: xanthine dehydrogenase family protein molybdopterin-binding subunit [Rhodospirillaceae bacterium]|jgi:carbon-monoxide dehydrogenase large subunit|nr:xanthine dehydrogenase family protein molybdopterin-binding subunit [Rhodospirillaceae bacterium]
MSKVKIRDSVRRIEDLRFLTGTGNYIDDVVIGGEVVGVVVRSPYAHAKINGFDATDAEALDGVLAVITGAEWAAQNFGPIPTNSAVKENRDGTPISVPDRSCLASERVRYVGEAVAFVVAETLAIARQAVELVDVDYDPLPAVTHPVKALEPGAPQLHDAIEGNLCVDWELGDKDGTEKAFAAADRIITLELHNNRVTGAPIEPRGAVAYYDDASGTYTIYQSSQNIHANRNQMATILGIDKDNIHHVAPDVGGGFGAKNSVYPEPVITLYATKKVGRPVKWVNDRAESFLSDTHGRSQYSTVEMAVMNDGTFKGLRTTTIGEMGAYCGTVGAFTPTGGSARTQGGPYAFEAMYYSAKAGFTNTAPLDPYRGAGRPEGSFQIERIVELAARELDMDPVELRRKNLIPKDALPLVTSMGLDVDCGDFPTVFKKTLAMTDRAGYEARAAASQAQGKCRGFAIAPYLECTGGMPKEHAVISFDDDGSVSLAIGSHSTGMGHETSLPQILAAQLGIDIERIKFTQADTDATPLGGGHGGSRGMEMGGNAVLQTAGEVIEKGKAIAAHHFECSVDDVEFDDGAYIQPGSNNTMTMDNAINAAQDHSTLPDDLAPGCLDTGSTFERGIISIPNGCHAAEAEVDPETGAVQITGFWVVDDFGTIVNPMLADGQVMGGIGQGLGQALLEQAIYDEESGQLVTGSLIDYALPRAEDMPPMRLDYYEDSPTKKTPLGAKGAGEAGCCGAPPAIVNAVLDALKGHGVTHIEMPLTPEMVWQAVRDA